MSDVRLADVTKISDDVLAVENIDVTARVESELRPERGDAVSLRFEPSNVHSFDTDGNRVVPDDENEHVTETA